MARWLQMQLATARSRAARRPVLRSAIAGDVDAGRLLSPPRLPGQFAVLAEFLRLRAGLGRAGLSRRQAHLARRRGVRLADRRRASARTATSALIAVNSEEGEVVRGLLYELLDHYLGLPDGEWPEKFHEFKMTRLNAAARSCTRQRPSRRRVGPSLPLDRYAGDYNDPWYGTIEIRRTGKGLTHRLPAFDRHGRPADAPSVRHVPDRTRRSSGSNRPM